MKAAGHMATQQAQANSRFPKDSLVGQSKRWNSQPSITAHNKSIKTYDILARQTARNTET